MEILSRRREEILDLAKAKSSRIQENPSSAIFRLNPHQFLARLACSRRSGLLGSSQKLQFLTVLQICSVRLQAGRWRTAGSEWESARLLQTSIWFIAFQQRERWRQHHSLLRLSLLSGMSPILRWRPLLLAQLGIMEVELALWLSRIQSLTQPSRKLEWCFGR